jgi:hypothetical protein
VLFVDYAKAFDHVDHTTVLLKMAAFGVDPKLLKWMHSCLFQRQQRVKIGHVFSSWATLNGGMPQGTWLDPYVFLTLINDLKADLPTFKLVDDVTITEIISQEGPSQMQAAADYVAELSCFNLLNIIFRKTKEMLLGSILRNPPPQVFIDDGIIERVTAFKLLDVTITNDLSWNEHVSAICAKAGRRLHLLTPLKRSSVPCVDLFQYYKSVIRPAIEYAAPVWQSSLTLEQRRRLEDLQRRALRIISSSVDYELYCVLYNIEPVSVRLNELAKSFFHRICTPGDCVNRLIPNERPIELNLKLRQSNKLPCLLCRTNRFYHLFLPYSLNNFQ